VLTDCVIDIFIYIFIFIYIYIYIYIFYFFLFYIFIFIFIYIFVYFGDITCILMKSNHECHLQLLPVKTTVTRCNDSALTRAFSVADFFSASCRQWRKIYRRAGGDAVADEAANQEERVMIRLAAARGRCNSIEAWVAAICCRAPPLLCCCCCCWRMDGVSVDNCACSCTPANYFPVSTTYRPWRLTTETICDPLTSAVLYFLIDLGVTIQDDVWLLTGFYHLLTL